MSAPVALSRRTPSNPGYPATDPTSEFFYHPRTLTALVCMIAVLVYVAFFSPIEDNTVNNVKLGIFSACLCFLVFGLLQFRDGPFIRPHPAIWRLVLAMGVLYQMFLVFLLFQNAHDSRQLMAYWDPELGKPLPERSYADACDLTWDNLRNQVDIFVVAHALGWFGKTLIIRDVWLCWIISIMFEIMEYSLQHQLNNFAECWWDHWILDVLVCNWLGIYIGTKTCEYFEMKQYSWRGIRQIPTYRGKLSRTAAQFTPHSWTKFEWGPTKSFRNYVGVVIVVACILVCELNAFYLKYLLWVPPEHPLVTYRLILMFLFGIPSVRELYDYMINPSNPRIGTQIWLMFANIVTEVLICIKLSKGEFNDPAPQYVVYFWTVLLTLLFVYPIYQFWFLPRFRKFVRSKGNKAR
ncbi:hypothetical protein H4R33_003126 [Dimargaris cristalligena]|uniref:PSS-domain-containing protein n=1 Tax=Dimargaris cristalligena TaxID=215637 RepID=A0A4V1J5N0_9FUNG|nr:hypothetical protein H4R33_003126 [Dimargaris cristalligena]RKP39629.1 PSS-domain-containing protein [Dimargaris cristalligena]|eukprot:RKP39629.1 PSS-domain-containing protein [Dimargaris cristalligena]